MRVRELIYGRSLLVWPPLCVALITLPLVRASCVHYQVQCASKKAVDFIPLSLVVVAYLFSLMLLNRFWVSSAMDTSLGMFFFFSLVLLLLLC